MTRPYLLEKAVQDEIPPAARFNGTSLVTKLQIAMAVLLLVIAAYVGYTLQRQQRMDRLMRGQIEQHLATRDNAEDMKVRLLLIHVTLLDFLASGHEGELEKSRASLVAARRDLEILRTQAADSELKTALAALSNEIDGYAAAAAPLAPGFPAGRRYGPATAARLTDALRARMPRLETTTEDVIREFQTALDESRANFRRMLAAEREKTIVAGAIVSLMLLVVLVRQLFVLRALRRLLHGVRLIEAGNFDFQIRSRRKDEIGQLTASFNSMVRAVRTRRDRLIRENVTDALTGLYNQRQFRPMLHDEMERARRLGSTFSLLMIDIDHFKHVNDAHGHETGNAVLQATARAMREHLREIDFLIRYGGDEFVAILPGSGVEEAAELARRLERLMAAVPLPDGTARRVTLSIGGATYPDHADAEEGLIKAADDALYRAKEAGRACVRWAQDAAVSHRLG